MSSSRPGSGVMDRIRPSAFTHDIDWQIWIGGDHLSVVTSSPEDVNQAAYAQITDWKTSDVAARLLVQGRRNAQAVEIAKIGIDELPNSSGWR